MKTIAIMQPTYLPWLGYFSLIDYVDQFVFLDCVQFDKRSWQQRNKILTANGPVWLSVPVLTRGKFADDISDICIDTSSNFSKKHINSIRQSYQKSEYFDEYFDYFSNIIDGDFEYISDLNIRLIVCLMEMLKIDCATIRASELGVEGSKDQLLANISKTLEAGRYVSPVGSIGYLRDSDAFSSFGIDVLYNDYQHPIYKQLHGSFEPYMSVIDLLFNHGPDSLEIIRSGFNPVSAESLGDEAT